MERADEMEQDQAIHNFPQDGRLVPALNCQGLETALAGRACRKCSQGLQGLIDSMQSFYISMGVVISIANTADLVFHGACMPIQSCSWCLHGLAVDVVYAVFFLQVLGAVFE